MALQVHQAKTLKQLHEGGADPGVLQEMRTATDLALRETNSQRGPWVRQCPGNGGYASNRDVAHHCGFKEQEITCYTIYTVRMVIYWNSNVNIIIFEVLIFDF